MAKVKRDNPIARLMDENRELKKDLRRAEYSLDLLEDLSKHLLDRLQSDNEVLMDTVEQHKKTVDKLSKEIKELKCNSAPAIDWKAVRALDQKTHQAESKILRTEIAKLKDENNKNRIDNNRLVAENVELNVKIQQMAKPIPLIDTLHVEIAKLKDDLRIEKDGRKALFEENEKLRSKVADVERGTVNNCLEVENCKLKMDNEILTDKIKDLESKAIENQQELIAAHDKINKLEVENEELFDFIHYWLKEKDVSKMKPAEIIAGMVDTAEILFDKHRKVK